MPPTAGVGLYALRPKVRPICPKVNVIIPQGLRKDKIFNNGKITLML